MGIRFQCPNGHRLNVKSHLAGKRGVCPECQAKFVIPTENAVQEASRIREEVVHSASAAQTPAAPSSPPPRNPPPEVWYVRMGSGEQFGPASREVFQQWVAEGRVRPNCWLWRTGWDDWQPADEVLQHLKANHHPPETPVEPAASGEFAVDYSVLMHRQNDRKRRRERAVSISMALGGLIFLMTVALVMILVF